MRWQWGRYNLPEYLVSNASVQKQCMSKHISYAAVTWTYDIDFKQKSNEVRPSYVQMLGPQHIWNTSVAPSSPNDHRGSGVNMLSTSMPSNKLICLWKIKSCLMDKSTISMAIFQFAMSVITRGYPFHFSRSGSSWPHYAVDLHNLMGQIQGGLMMSLLFLGRDARPRDDLGDPLKQEEFKRTSVYPPVSKHGNWKSTRNWLFNRKIIYTSCIFRCHVLITGG